MALFSDDEDYQDDQGQNQQPLNTLDHIDSSRNLYNNIKISRAVVQPEAQDRRRQPRAVPLIHQERLLLHHKESHRRQAKRPSKLRAVPPKIQPCSRSFFRKCCDCRCFRRFNSYTDYYSYSDWYYIIDFLSDRRFG